MGTRNLVIVFYKGRYSIIQYGQWDGYPEGQGWDLVTFLRIEGNIEKLKAVLDAGSTIVYEVDTETMSDDERQALYDANHPSMTRDAGAKILTMAIDATAESPIPVEFNKHFIIDGLFCEWAWVVDLDEECLEGYTHWGGYNLEEHLWDSRFMKWSDNQDLPKFDNARLLPGLVKTIMFSELPATQDAMADLFNAVRRHGRDDEDEQEEEVEEEQGTENQDEGEPGQEEAEQENAVEEEDKKDGKDETGKNVEGLTSQVDKLGFHEIPDLTPA